MRIQIRLFARARDLAGADRLDLNLPDGATTAELRRRLAGACPPLADLLPRCAVAVNNEFAEDDMAIAPDADVALLPPVSGGQRRINLIALIAARVL